MYSLRLLVIKALKSNSRIDHCNGKQYNHLPCPTSRGGAPRLTLTDCDKYFSSPTLTNDNVDDDFAGIEYRPYASSAQ